MKTQVKIIGHLYIYGILAVAAIALILYVALIWTGHLESAGPLLFIAVIIVFAFILYMIIKQVMRTSARS